MPTLRLRAAEKLLGERTPAIRRAWWRFRSGRPFERDPALRVAKRFVRTNGLTVRHGPFAGMRYPAEAIAATPIVPRLLGSFELELQPVVREVIDRDFSTIVNVGCADGYYAVGFALTIPGGKIHAFDSDPSFRSLCAKIAAMNQVADRIAIHGTASITELQDLAECGGELFVLCDCEGCELELLDPTKAPMLRNASILVELHDFLDRNLSRVLLGRFAETHQIQVIGSSVRDPGNYEELRSFTSREAAVAVDEFRPEAMEWAWMTPLAGPT